MARNGGTAADGSSAVIFSLKLVVLSSLIPMMSYYVIKHHACILSSIQGYLPESVLEYGKSFHQPRRAAAATTTTTNEAIKSSTTKATKDTTDQSKDDRLISSQELSQYSSTSSTIYLSLLGQVFDVSSGRTHYGDNGGYSFFSGRDASRAFTTGDFSEAGLTDDVEGLSGTQCADLKQWLEFYHEKYIYIGKLAGGRFYDLTGLPTPALGAFQQCVESGLETKRLDEEDRQRYPPCNSRWSQSEGGYVSCSDKSGGIDRNWIGVPRQYFRPGQKDPRCACVRTSGPPGGSIGAAVERSNTDRGDLDSPMFRQYTGCQELAAECKIS